MNKQLTKRKKQRHLERLSQKQIHQAADVAIRHGIVITLQAVKNIFGDRATNPKCEELVCRILKLWEDLGQRKVNIQTIVDSVEVETGIKYDLESGNIYNTKAKVKKVEKNDK